MSRLRTLPLYRALALLLLFGVLAMRVTVPQGYMWSVEGNGWPSVVLCPDQNPMPAGMPIAMAMPMDHGDGAKHGSHDHKPADHPCGFAAAGAAVDLAALPHAPIVPVEAASTTLLAFHRSFRPGLGLAAPPPPQTGPPALI